MINSHKALGSRWEFHIISMMNGSIVDSFHVVAPSFEVAEEKALIELGNRMKREN